MPNLDIAKKDKMQMTNAAVITLNNSRVVISFYILLKLFNFKSKTIPPAKSKTNGVIRDAA